MTDFKQRLEKAVERGRRTSSARAHEAAQQALSEEELKRLHTRYRLDVSEYIERCLEQLPQHFPGFRYETIVGERGWGAGISRDDFVSGGGRRANSFSRLEVYVRPYSALHVIELAAKGTIRNKEVFSRSHYELLSDADVASYKELIDLWVLEYAELYAAKN